MESPEAPDNIDYLAPLDIHDETLVIAVVPLQRDEFRCQRCFLIKHSSHMATGQVCVDCA